jgi:hypothetical protein
VLAVDLELRSFLLVPLPEVVLQRPRASVDSIVDMIPEAEKDFEVALQP